MSKEVQAKESTKTLSRSGEVEEESCNVGGSGNGSNGAVKLQVQRSKSQSSSEKDRRRKKSSSPLQESVANAINGNGNGGNGSTSGGESPVRRSPEVNSRRKSPHRKSSSGTGPGSSSTIWHKNSPRGTATKGRGNSPGLGGQPKVFNSSTGLFTPKTPKSNQTPRDSNSKKSRKDVPYQIPRGVTASKTPSSSSKKTKHKRRWSTDQDVPPPIPLVNPIPTSSVVWQSYNRITATVDTDGGVEGLDEQSHAFLEGADEDEAEDMSTTSTAKGSASDRSDRSHRGGSNLSASSIGSPVFKSNDGLPSRMNGMDQMQMGAGGNSTRPRSSSWGTYSEEDIALLSRLERLRQAEYELQREKQLLTEEMWEAAKKREGTSAINWRDEVSKLVTNQQTTGVVQTTPSDYTPSSMRFDEKVNYSTKSSKSNMAAIMHQKRNSARGASSLSTKSPKLTHSSSGGSHVHPVAIEHVHYQIADINTSDEDELLRTASFKEVETGFETGFSTERSLAPDANEMAIGKSFEEEESEQSFQTVVSSSLSVSPVRNGTFAFSSRRPTGVPKLDLSQLTVHNKLIELEGSDSSEDQPNNFKKNLDSSMSISSPRSAFSSPRSRERSSSIGSSMSGSTNVTSSSFARV
eukprot:TRINITY_DN3352_c0_g1_i2.p1 TRINITY_DN3352_c0_g1~~TRINITY_DN3352_c0_g1_i2.p1  ORF type:complete len:634 (+),score=201.84 TRINITY_DN3352_c0_g1_i2:142-2043(+)